MHSLTSNSSVDKVVAVGILTMMLVMVYLVFSQVYLDGLNTLDQEISLVRKKSAKVKAILDKAPYFKTQIQRAKGSASQNRMFLISKQPSTAISEIQNITKKLISTHTKAKILTIKPYPVVQHDGYSEVSVEIRMKGLNHNELQMMLFGIERHQPLILIKELEINQTRLNYKSLVAKRGKRNDLNSSMVISGYFKNKQTLNME